MDDLLDDFFEEATIIRMPDSSVEHTKAIIQKRIAFAEKQCGFEPGSIVQITDPAHQAICDLTHSSPGLALEVVNRVMPSAEQMANNQPYIITEKHINQLGLTFQALCEYWDSPLRGAVVINAKPTYDKP